MSSRVTSSSAISNIQTAIGYDFRHAPRLLLALSYPIDKIPGSSTDSMEAFQTRYRVFMALQGKHPSDKVLAECGRRIDIVNYMFDPASREIGNAKAAASMRAIIGAVWADSRDELEVIRVWEKLQRRITH